MSCTAGLSALFTPTVICGFPWSASWLFCFSPASLQLRVYIFVLREEEEKETEWKGQITPCTLLPEGTHRERF